LEVGEREMERLGHTEVEAILVVGNLEQDQILLIEDLLHVGEVGVLLVGKFLEVKVFFQ
jgi:hypothetical protein